jgi:hypothetical protein
LKVKEKGVAGERGRNQKNAKNLGDWNWERKKRLKSAVQVASSPKVKPRSQPVNKSQVEKERER